MITSVLLNIRSQETNLHAAMNSLFLWDGTDPRHVIQILNHFAFCASDKYQQKAVKSISTDVSHNRVPRMRCCERLCTETKVRVVYRTH
jgi:hypothetical protein